MSELFQGNNTNVGTLVPTKILQETILRGTLGFNRDALKAIHPAYTGYTHIFVTKGIRFLEDFKNLNPNFQAEAEVHFNNFKFLLEHASLSYNGTPDLQLNTSDINTGWSDRTVAVPTSASYDSNQFSVTMLESYGEPLRKCIEFIINGITDAEAKYTHMYGSPLEPILENITFEMMVVTTDQTLKNITDITVWHASFPTGVDRDNLNWEQGNIDMIAPKSITFRGVIKPNAMHYKAQATNALKSRFKFYTSIRNAEMTL